MGRIIAVVALVGALAAPALAHEGHDHYVRGTVKEATAARLILTDTAGKEQDFAVTPATEFYRGKKAARWSDVKPGERAAIHAGAGGQGATAEVVLLGAAPAGG